MKWIDIYSYLIYIVDIISCIPDIYIYIYVRTYIIYICIQYIYMIIYVIYAFPPLAAPTQKRNVVPQLGLAMPTDSWTAVAIDQCSFCSFPFSLPCLSRAFGHGLLSGIAGFHLAEKTCALSCASMFQDTKISGQKTHSGHLLHSHGSHGPWLAIKNRDFPIDIVELYTRAIVG